MRLSRLTPTIVGFIFLYAGIYKLITPVQAIAALTSIGFSTSISLALVCLITVIELHLGITLTTRLDLRFSLIAAITVLFTFSLFLFVLSTMANPPSCGCMGLGEIFRSSRHNAMFGLLRNCALMWLLSAGYSYYCRAAPPGLVYEI